MEQLICTSYHGSHNLWIQFTPKRNNFMDRPALSDTINPAAVGSLEGIGHVFDQGQSLTCVCQTCHLHPTRQPHNYSHHNRLLLSLQ